MNSKHSVKKAGILILLKKNISKGQITGYVIANIIGLTVILAGLLFYCDSRNNGSEKDTLFSEDYIVISKKVKGVNLEPVAFSDEELKELSEEPWVKSVGHFTPSRFSVDAAINMGGRGLSSHLFMESVPDEFFDTMPVEWDFDSQKKFIPIILNKDYLALYNFGFAIPQGLPQLSEEVIGSVPLKIRITGENGLQDVFDATVVGFSSRLNTIAVPQKFMDWANSRFAPDSGSRPSRLILKTDRMSTRSIQEFISDKGYEIAGDKANDSKLSEFLALISGVVAGIGILISVLAIFILILSIFLLLQKSRGMLRSLILLGYSPKMVGKYYERMVIITNSLITLIAVGLTFVCRLIWMAPMESLGLGHGNVLPMIGCALGYFIFITVLNCVIIRNHILKIWHNK